MTESAQCDISFTGIAYVKLPLMRGSDRRALRPWSQNNSASRCGEIDHAAPSVCYCPLEEAAADRRVAIVWRS
ncbi:hypothetical protein EVAR_41727_1 [Eumeta japonica]|uniref:Uncharacterized protein n=1 Tax=Eumeta variegata TaxID=151549 RepID=A0A4C1XG06_EUMVA|nr:hypothetical protein EVAR_41727_1 [Eumeta japonica]